jgi:hypothetical protein
MSQFELNLITQLQQENDRYAAQCDCLTTQCDRLQAALTDLRSRYESLQKSELRYRQLFENAPVSILLIGSDGLMRQGILPLSKCTA